MRKSGSICGLLIALGACAAPTAQSTSAGATQTSSVTVVAPGILHPATPADVRAAITAPGAKLTVVNVWATWCEPCVHELPDVLRASRDRQAQGARLVLVSVDFESERAEAEAFLRKQGVDFTTYVKTGDDQAFIDTLSKSWSGSIPVTLIYDAQGNVRFFREGEVDYAALTAAIDTVLD